MALPALRQAGGAVRVEANERLRGLQLPALGRVDGVLSVKANPRLARRVDLGLCEIGI